MSSRGIWHLLGDTSTLGGRVVAGWEHDVGVFATCVFPTEARGRCDVDVLSARAPAAGLCGRPWSGAPAAGPPRPRGAGLCGVAHLSWAGRQAKETGVLGEGGGPFLI